MKIISETLTEPTNIPKVLLKLRGRINEGLNNTDNNQFLLRFDACIAPGADLSDVWRKFAIRTLREIALPTVSGAYPRCKSAVERVIAGLETNWADDDYSQARYAASIAFEDDVGSRVLPQKYDIGATLGSSSSAVAAEYAASKYEEYFDLCSHDCTLVVIAIEGAYAGANHGDIDLKNAGVYAANKIIACQKMADILCEELAAAPIGNIQEIKL